MPARAGIVAASSIKLYRGHYVEPGTNYTRAFIDTGGNKVALTEYPPAGIDYVDGMFLWEEYYRKDIERLEAERKAREG